MKRGKKKENSEINFFSCAQVRSFSNLKYTHSTSNKLVLRTYMTARVKILNKMNFQKKNGFELTCMRRSRRAGFGSVRRRFATYG
jgi:hypothetical protein